MNLDDLRFLLYSGVLRYERFYKIHPKGFVNTLIEMGQVDILYLLLNNSRSVSNLLVQDIKSNFSQVPIEEVAIKIVNPKLLDIADQLFDVLLRGYSNVERCGIMSRALFYIIDENLLCYASQIREESSRLERLQNIVKAAKILVKHGANYRCPVRVGTKFMCMNDMSCCIDITTFFCIVIGNLEIDIRLQVCAFLYNVYNASDEKLCCDGIICKISSKEA